MTRLDWDKARRRDAMRNSPSPESKPAWRKYTAKWTSKCSLCDRLIVKGDEMYWRPPKINAHPRCAVKFP